MDMEMLPLWAIVGCLLLRSAVDATEAHGVANPCTMDNLLGDQLYHAYPHDQTRYIQCTGYGKAYIMQCPAGLTWDEIETTCAEKPYPEKRAPQPQQFMPMARRYMWRIPPMPAPTTPKPAPEKPTMMMNPAEWGERWPNPCTHERIRYVPHPTDAQRYFECSNGQPTEKYCQRGEVWIQPNRECRQLAERIPKPEEGASPNPCIGNNERFHPFPGDQHKYIECQTWYKLQVWDCGASAVWVQNQLACVGAADRRPSPPQGPASPTRSPSVTPIFRPIATMRPQTRPPPKNHPVDFCKNTTSYYHTYPLDPQKFIQCDEYGNMYIRQCGPNKAWSDFHKTCIGHLNVTVPGTSQPTAEETNNNSPETAVYCPSGYSFDSLTRLCKRTNIMTQPQPKVTIRVEPITILNEMVQVTCPPQLVYNPAAGKCEYNPSNIQNDYNPFSPSCEDSFLWDTQLQMCVQAIRVNNLPPSNSIANNIPDNFVSSDLTLGLSPDFVAPQQNFNPAQESEIPAPNPLPTRSPPPPPKRPDYNGPNPCLSGTGYYFPYKGDARFFIQCDQMRNMVVQACPGGLMWNQAILTCVDWLVAVPDQPIQPAEPGLENVLDNDDLTVIAELDMDNEDEANILKALNPCIDSESMFFMYPLDPTRYIMCANGRPYVMLCPQFSMWDDTLQTCQWPPSADEIENSEETDVEDTDVGDTDVGDTDVGDTDVGETDTGYTDYDGDDQAYFYEYSVNY